MFSSIAIVHNIPIHYQHLLFTALREKGVPFHVLFVARGSADRREPIPLSRDAYDYEIGCPTSYEKTPALARVRFVWDALNRLRPSAVIICGYQAPECWAAWAWGRLRKRPRIIWFESNYFDYPRRPWRELPKRIFLRGCVAAHVYGTNSRDYLARLGMPRDRITVKQAVVDVHRFRTSVMEKRVSAGFPRTLLYVGRFGPEKNLTFLLKAFARLRQDLQNPRLRLRLIGYGPLESELKAVTSALGLEAVVEFAGPALQRDLPSHYRQADFFILPSTREAWGLVVLEAMLCRLPVLVSQQCGCCRDVVNERTGWQFSPWDENGLAELLDSVSRLPVSQIETMGAAAYATAQSYSPERAADRVIESLSRIAGTGVARGGADSTAGVPIAAVCSNAGRSGAGEMDA